MRWHYSFLLLAGLAGCAPTLVLPPIAPRAAWEERLAADAFAVPPVPDDAPPVRREVDDASGYTRTFVTTHQGAYIGWVQKPQLTFFALTRGAEPGAGVPAALGLVFRTLEPEAVTGPRLVLGCPGQSDTIPVGVDSRVAATGSTHSHFLTYLLPTPRVAAFAACAEGVLQVGQVSVRFSGTQLGGVRALLRALGAAPGGT